MGLCDMEAELGEFVAGLEPETLPAEAAAGLVDTFATIETLGAAGKALAARRVAASNLWRGVGERSAAHWLARRSGVSIGSAMSTLETAARLPELPAVDAAMRAGELSSVQANEIASAAGPDPGAGAELVDVARNDGVAGLKDKCRRVKAAAAPDEMARHRAIHASRSLRHWNDPDGAGRLDGRFTPEVLAELLVVPACHVRVGLEIDHVEPWSATRITKLDALAKLCRFHHAQKTHEGYRLEGGPGTLALAQARRQRRRPASAAATGAGTATTRRR